MNTHVRLILSLSFVSGICGLAYEILYSRILTSYVGSLYYVNATILISFFLGIGIASLLGRRLIKYLWLVELLIGIYAIIFSWLWANHGPWFLQNIPHVANNMAFLVATVFLFVFPAALLIGFCIPLFTYYVEIYESSSGKRGEGFDKIYILYNLGAGVCVLFIEYILLRNLGIKSTVNIIAAMNIFNAALLWRFKPALASNDDILSVPKMARRSILVLFILSVASGLNQLILLKVIHTVFGPFVENFAILLAVTLFGISLGTWIVHRFKIRFSSLIALAPTGLILSYILIVPLIYFWTAINGNFIGVSKIFLKTIIISLMCGAPLTIFGATVGALHRELIKWSNRTGQLLAISSFGNCLGYVLTIFILFELLPHVGIFLLIVILVFLCFNLLTFWRNTSYLKTRIFSLCLLPILFFSLSNNIFYLSYFMFSDYKLLSNFKETVKGYASYKKFDSEVNLLDTKRYELIIINGHYSVENSKDGSPNQYEIMFGVPSCLYPPKREHALFLGVGTGQSVGAVAQVFNKVTAVEIDPVMIDLLPYFSKFNFDLINNNNVDIIHDDGFVFLQKDHKKYDVIVNNVPNPQYFSASKLWTREFYELVKEHLTEHGVYSQWIRSSFGERSLKIVFQTLKESFKECHVVFLTPHFYHVICSDNLMQPRLLSSEQWRAALRKRISPPFDKDPNILMEAIIFPINDIVSKDWGVLTNTFDKPVLVFSSEGNFVKSLNRENNWWLFEMMNVDFNRSVLKDSTLSESERERRCRILDQWLGFNEFQRTSGPCSR